MDEPTGYNRAECDVCLRHPEDCECHECPVCRVAGDPNCYDVELPARTARPISHHGQQLPEHLLARHCERVA